MFIGFFTHSFHQALRARTELFYRVCTKKGDGEGKLETWGKAQKSWGKR